MNDPNTHPMLLGLAEAPDSVYCNLDHMIDDDIVQLLEKKTHYAQHAALDFCGWVWYDGKNWHDYVMCYGSHMETVSGSSLRAVIDRVNADYGDG